MAITEPTPMTMPSRVSAERSLLRVSARKATFRIAHDFVWIVSLREAISVLPLSIVGGPIVTHIHDLVVSQFAVIPSES